MALSKEQLENLYNKYVHNQCTQEELEVLINELGSQPATDNEAVITQLFDKTWDGLEVFPDKYKLPDLSLPNDNGHESPVIEMYSAKSKWMRIAAAAAVIFILGSGAYWWLARTPKTEVVTNDKKITPVNDVAPGGNKAILILGDNSAIVLDSAANGNLAQQGSSVVSKTRDGQLKYVGGNSGSEISYNTLKTPRGGQYQLVLPDGSKVWLNAASSIRFPTAFTGNERKVEITGEAYFEVVPVPLSTGKRLPFIVNILPSSGGAGGGRVEVLGTHFNVNAYDDEEAIKTTLLEGKVKVQNQSARNQSTIGNPQSAILMPGEQAVCTADSRLTIHDKKDVDLESIMAWKNGLFHFENVDLRSVMRQLSRWYDIEVEYKGAVKNEPLFIEVPRNTNLSDVLKVIESTAGLRLTIEGKKVTVL
jgi:transmembrane sensor